MYDAINVAKLVINECAAEGHPVTNLKLQKILYFMWLDWYKERKEPLFDNEIQAWHFGPVIPEVYRRYRRFVADPIKKDDEEDQIPESDARPLRELARKYNERPIGDLIEESHREGSPWARVGGDSMLYTKIDRELMIDESERCRYLRIIHSFG